MKNRYEFYILLLATASLMQLFSCKESAKPTLPPPDVEVTNVIVQDVPMIREFVGQAYGLQDIPIRARVDGFLEEINFVEGSRVEKGRVLYRIDAQPYKAEVASMQQKVAEALSYLTNADNELKRYRPLAEINAVSKSDLDAAIASREAAEASYEAAKANLELAEIKLSYTEIRSPINGLIGKTEARVGEYVGREPNPVILNTVSKTETIRVQFFLPETAYINLMRWVDMKDAERTPEERERRTTAELILADGSLYDQTGEVDFIDRNVDASTGTILVQTSFPNPRSILRPGMYAKVRLELTTEKGRTLVPQKCVTELQGQYSVYVVDDSNQVQVRKVEALEKIGDLWLIDKGLEPSDQVVLTGLQKVAAGVTVNPTMVEFQSTTNE